MNGEAIVLTQRAQQQLIVLNALERGELFMAQAADLLGLSVRQVRRGQPTAGAGHTPSSTATAAARRPGASMRPPGTG